MTETMSASSIDLDAFGSIVEATTGLRLAGHRRADLVRSVERRDRSTIDSLGRLLQLGVVDDPLVEELVSDLTIGETSFFRHDAQFAALRQRILPERLAARSAGGSDRRVRIWSAGCATGEEVWSLAILARELLGELAESSVSILGTDINRRFLAKANEGEYGEWSFRGVPSELRDRAFERHGNRSRIRDHDRPLVQFRYMNLVENGWPSLFTGTTDLDVVLCRNVLIYFGADRVRSVVSRIWTALAPGGWFLPGPAEAIAAEAADFEVMELPGAILFRKPLSPPVARDRSSVVREASGSPVARRSEAASKEATTVVAKEAPQPIEPPRSRIELARSLADQNRFEEALSLLSETSLEDSDSAAAFQLAAIVHLGAGRHREATEMLRKSLFLDPDQPVAHYFAGLALRREGSIRAARRHFSIAQRLLEGREESAELPGSDGLTVRRFRATVEAELERAAP